MTCLLRPGGRLPATLVHEAGLREVRTRPSRTSSSSGDAGSVLRTRPDLQPLRRSKCPQRTHSDAQIHENSRSQRPRSARSSETLCLPLSSPRAATGPPKSVHPVEHRTSKARGFDGNTVSYQLPTDRQAPDRLPVVSPSLSRVSGRGKPECWQTGHRNWAVPAPLTTRVP